MTKFDKVNQVKQRGKAGTSRRARCSRTQRGVWPTFHALQERIPGYQSLDHGTVGEPSEPAVQACLPLPPTCELPGPVGERKLTYTAAVR